MESGKLRHAVTIQSVTESRDAHGGTTLTWGTFHACHAAISPITGKEYLQASQVQAQVTHRIRVRRYAGITPRMRVLFGTRVFAVELVRDLEERRAEVELLCREEV